jgi:hypothetical protein
MLLEDQGEGFSLLAALRGMTTRFNRLATLEAPLNYIFIEQRWQSKIGIAVSRAAHGHNNSRSLA